MRKICFVIVNRSNYARLKPLLTRIKKEKKFKIQIIACSSAVLNKYGDVGAEILKDGFNVDFKFLSYIAGEKHESMPKSTGLILLELTTIFNKLKPNIVVTFGDRFETMATAITASYLNIFLCHIQGGELSGSIDEKVRHAVTKLSDLHLVCTNRSKNILIQMGENKKRVFNTGCTSIDFIKKINFKKQVNLKNYNFGVGRKVDLNKKYFLVLIHPNTLFYKQNYDLTKEVCNVIKFFKKQTIWIWPNIDAGSDLISKYLSNFRDKNKELIINFYQHFKNEDYIKLMKNCQCFIGNSSSGIRESGYLGVPVVDLGSRQNNREKSNNIITVEPKSKKIIAAINKQIKTKKFKKSFLYGSGNSSKKIISILKKTDLNIEKKFQLLNK